MSENTSEGQVAAIAIVVGIGLVLLGLGVYLSLGVYEIVVDILYKPEKVVLIDTILKHDEVRQAVAAMQQGGPRDIDYVVLFKLFITIFILYFLMRVLGAVIAAVFSGVASVLQVLPESIFGNRDVKS